MSVETLYRLVYGVMQFCPVVARYSSYPNKSAPLFEPRFAIRRYVRDEWDSGGLHAKEGT